jgi:hypothetical protein
MTPTRQRQDSSDTRVEKGNLMQYQKPTLNVVSSTELIRGVPDLLTPSDLLPNGHIRENDVKAAILED